MLTRRTPQRGLEAVQGNQRERDQQEKQSLQSPESAEIRNSLDRLEKIKGKFRSAGLESTAEPPSDLKDQDGPASSSRQAYNPSQYDAQVKDYNRAYQQNYAQQQQTAAYYQAAAQQQQQAQAAAAYQQQA